MPSLSEILNDPNYVNANEETKAAIFTKYAPLDENYTQANAATQSAIRGRFGVEGQPGIGSRGGFDTALYSGYQGLKGSLAGLAGRTGLMSLESAKQVQEEAEEKGKKAFKPTEGGWTTDFTGKFAETLGQSVPYMIAPIAAAGVATVAGAPGVVATGISGLASAIQFAGSNLQRQQERGIALEDTNLTGAIATAIPQAALETLSFRMIPGVQRLFGKAGKEVTEAQAAEIAKQGIVRSTAAYGAQGARTGGVEGMTEVGQQFLERLQAGLTLGDQDAINEFVESFIGGGILGGTISIPGTAMRRDQARQMAAQAPKAPETTAEEQETTETAPPAAPPVTPPVTPPVALPEGVPSDVALDQAAMEEEFRRSQGQLPIKPAQVAQTTPAQITQATPAQAVQVEPPELELPLGAAPESAEQRTLPPVAQPAQPKIVQPSAEDIIPLNDKGELVETPKAAETAEPVAEGGVAANTILQNRERSSPTSIAQMNAIANKPDYSRVAFSNSFLEGAPVVFGAQTLPAQQVGRRGSVVSAKTNRKIPVQYAVVDADQLIASNAVDGSSIPEYASPEFTGFKAVTNGRIAGLKEGYVRGTMGQYKQDLLADDIHGISPDVINRIKNPILVRIMPQDQVTQDIADESNTSSTLALSATERAKNDANRIDLDGLEFREDGAISPETVRGFVAAMPQSEQQELIDKQGRPTRQAYDRLNAAIFYKAYGNDALVSLAAEAKSVDAANIINGLSQAAPQMAQLAGTGEYDIRPQVVQSAEMAINASRQGQKLADVIAQQELISEDSIAKQVLQLFANNTRSAKKIGEGLRRIATDVNAEASRSQEPDMFGEAPAKVPAAKVVENTAKQIMLDAGYTPQDLNVIGFTKASPELQAEVAELERQMQKLGLDSGAIIDGIKGAQNLSKLEYYNRAKSELAKAITQAAKQGGRGDVSQVNVPPPPAELTSPSEEELKAKQEAADKAAADKARADREADAKAKAEQDRKDIAARSEKAAGEFELGKTAEEDLTGQKNIFVDKKELPELDITGQKTPKGRNPYVVAAGRLFQQGKMSREDFNAYADKYTPIAEVSMDVLEPPTPLQKIVDFFHDPVDAARVEKSIPNGTKVGLRMDVPALNAGLPVVSIHTGKANDDPKTGLPYKTAGKVIKYASTGHIKNVTFAPRSQEKSLNMGINPVKEPLQTAEGEWVNTSPEETLKKVKELSKDSAWTQVGFDPSRRGYFYDRSTGEPVSSASELYQIGRFLLAKDVKYASKDEFLYNVGKKNKSKEFKTLDGFTFYLTEDGKVVDNLDPDKVDMSWDSFDDFMESTSNLRTIFPDQEIASSNSAEQIRKENIAKYASLKQKLAAIQRRFVKDKSKPFDKESYKYLSLQAQDLKDVIESTKEPKTSPVDFLARAAKELADGNISQEVYDVVDTMYKKNPNLLNGLRLSVKSTDVDAAGQFLALTKIVRLFKETEGTTNPSTLRHEVTHSLEQLMNQDAQASLVDAWGKSLLKATRNAKTDEEKAFFVSVGNFIENPTNETMQLAADAMPDYSYYQYINPSEFWAVNAEPLMASYLGGGWQRFKTSVKGLFEALKNVLGFDNKSSVYKTFNNVINVDKERKSPMLSDYVRMVGKMLPTYNIPKPTNKPSQATLPSVLPAPKSLPLKPKPAATWQSLEPMTWKDTRAIQLFDKHRNLDLVQKEITEIVGEIGNDLNAYRAETLAHGRAERQVKDFLSLEFRPIIKEMKDGNVTDEALTEYLVMRHAKEANDLIAKRNPNDPTKQDKGSGVSYQQRNDYFKALDPAKKKVFESLAKKVDGVLKKTRDLLEEGGVITKEQKEAWESLFEFYVPLRREESDYSLPSSSYRRVGDYAKSRTGSAKDVIDVLSNIAANREIAVHRIEKEKVNRAVYGLAVMNPNPEYWMAISPDAIKNKDLLVAELEDKFDLSRQDAEAFVKNIMAEPTKERFNKETGVVDRYIDTTAKYADYVLPVKIDGKDRFVFFNPKNDRSMQMVQSLRGLDVPKLGAAMQMVAPVTRFFSAINTQYNLIFGAWNFARDIQGARLNLSTTPIAEDKNAVFTGTFSAIPDIYKAVREQNADKPFSDTEDGSWDDFTRHGGKVGYKDQFARLNQSTNIVNRELAALDRGITMSGAYKVANWISNVNDVLENATRLSAYRVALDKFKKEAEANNAGGKISEKQLEDMKARAADIAKNISVNFNRKGTFGVTAGSLYAFFNASAQGTKRLYETLSGPKGKTIMAAGIGIGIAQAIALAMAGFDEDEPTEFIKQKNLIIPTGDGKYVMWPMPFGFNIFPNLGRIFFETASKASKGQSVTPQLFNAVTMLANAFNPLGGGGLLQMVAPTVADPIVALIENKDAFGRPISRESRATSPVPGYKLSRDPSPSISQFLAEFINTITFGDKDKRGALSPTADQIDYLGKQLGGGVYREASGILTYVSNKIQDKETPDYKVPIAGKIVGDLNSPPAISQRFYSNVIKMAEHEASIKGRIERRESVTEYMRNNPEASMWRRANTLENEISKLNRRRREMVEKQEPIERIKKLDDQKTRMMKQFNDQVRKYN